MADGGPDGRLYTSVRRMCGAIGVSFSTQLRKLNDAYWAGLFKMNIPDERGPLQDHTIIDLDSLPLWIASINTKKVSVELRAKIELYQREAKQVLADWFLRKQAPAAAPAAAPAGISEVIVRALVDAVSLFVNAVAAFTAIITEKRKALSPRPEAVQTCGATRWRPHGHPRRSVWY